jgi:acyl-CoA synthetase (AMP-forming)/AMP-acid ligase II
VDQQAVADLVVVTSVLMNSMNIGTVIDAAAAGAPDRAALIVGGRTVSYGELAAAVDRCAAGLLGYGAEGRRVAVVDVGSLLSIATMLAAPRIGGAAALMNPALTSTELGELISTSGCAAVAVAGESYVENLREAGVSQVLSGSQLLRADGAAAPPPADDVDDRDGVVLFTSGTTGLPKAIGITNRQLMDRTIGIAQPFSADTPPTVTMMSVPFFHDGGVVGLVAHLYGGNTYVLLPKFDAGEWLRLVQEHRPVSTFIVPTMLQRILDHPDFDGTDLSSMVAVAYGAAAAPVELVSRAMSAMPNVAFANVFGQTETLGAYTVLSPEEHHDLRRAGSVGRPLPGVDLRVVDPDTGADVQAGAVGELWVSTSLHVGEGWLHTGDLGRRDSDGYIYPSGRLKDTINRGGEKFGPVEVEDALRSHPAVSDVAVAGVADDEMGQRVGVAMVARGPVTLAELRAHCGESIAYFKLPERLLIVDDIPYSATGKINRRELGALIAAGS